MDSGMRLTHLTLGLPGAGVPAARFAPEGGGFGSETDAGGSSEDFAEA